MRDKDKETENILLERAMTILQHSTGNNELVEELKEKLETDYQEHINSKEAGIWGLS